MGRRNESGRRVQCQHCGYTWLTESQADVTSCPKCGYRVRIKPIRSSHRDAPTSRELISNSPRAPLI